MLPCWNENAVGIRGPKINTVRYHWPPRLGQLQCCRNRSRCLNPSHSRRLKMSMSQSESYSQHQSEDPEIFNMKQTPLLNTFVFGQRQDPHNTSVSCSHHRFCQPGHSKIHCSVYPTAWVRIYNIPLRILHAIHVPTRLLRPAGLCLGWKIVLH